jgi:hypothetical protein
LLDNLVACKSVMTGLMKRRWE